MTKINILSGLNIPSQIALDPKTRCINEPTLKNLGIDNNLAYTYYKGLEVTCIEERTKWEWKEVEIGDEKLLENDFVYPNGLIVEDIDYSNKSFNFAKVSIEVELQDLQNVLDTGNYADIDDGLASIEIFGGVIGNRYFEFFSNDADFIKSSNIRINSNRTIIQNYGDTYWSQLSLNNGGFNFRKTDINIGFATSISITDPVVATTINFPAKTITGTYNVIIEPSTTYLVSNLPIGQLGDRATVTDAISPTYLGVAVGGGSTIAPVWHNGVTWVTN